MVGWIYRNLIVGPRLFKVIFSESNKADFQSMIKSSERVHNSQIKLVAEASWKIDHILAGLTVRERALEIFGRLRVWDTEDNRGILIYLLLSEGVIEIVADRGVTDEDYNNFYEGICSQLKDNFQNEQYVLGIKSAIQALTDKLSEDLKKSDRKLNNKNEVSDEIVLIR